MLNKAAFSKPILTHLHSHALITRLDANTPLPLPFRNGLAGVVLC